ncbi:MAG: hypothetical protein V1659_03825, partial [Candidatus Woesearchaeota archaeon]
TYNNIGQHTIYLVVKNDKGEASNWASIKVTVAEDQHPEEEYCGDNLVNTPLEQCDGSSLNGATCQDFGFEAGELGCFGPRTLNPCRFDTSQCHNNPEGTPQLYVSKIECSERVALNSEQRCSVYVVNQANDPVFGAAVTVKYANPLSTPNEKLSAANQIFGECTTDSASGVCTVKDVQLKAGTKWVYAEAIKGHSQYKPDLDMVPLFRYIVSGNASNPPSITPPIPDITLRVGEYVKIDLSKHEFDIEDSGSNLRWNIFSRVVKDSYLATNDAVSSQPVRVSGSLSTAILRRVSSAFGFGALSAKQSQSPISSYKDPAFKADLNGKVLLVQGLKKGEGKITLVLRDSDNNFDSQIVNVLVLPIENNNPKVEIISPREGESFTNNQEILFSAKAKDADGRIADYMWTSSIDGQLIHGDGEPVNFSAKLSVGRHRIFVIVHDNNGNAAVGSVLVNVHQSQDVAPACSDGLDNDDDGFTDMDDPGCDSPDDTDEYNLALDAEDGIFFGRIRIFGTDWFEAVPGGEVTLSVEVQNRINQDIDDLKATLYVPDLGIKVKSRMFDLAAGESETVSIHAWIPDDASEGEYDVIVALGNSDIRRSTNRWLDIKE